MNDKEYKRNLPTLIENLMINKVDEFKQSLINKDEHIDSYELSDLIIHRDLLIKTFEETNKELKKDKQKIRLDFDEDAYEYFNELNYIYFKKEGCVANDGGMFHFKMQAEIYAFDLLIKIYTNDKELKFMPKRIKSKLPIYRIGFIKN